MEAMDRTNWGLLYGALVTQVMEVKRVFCFKMNKIGEDKKGKRLSVDFINFPPYPLIGLKKNGKLTGIQ